MNYSKSLLLIIFFLAIQSCATIIGDKEKRYHINSEPDKAEVKITDERGIVIEEGQTPMNILLSKSDGSYFGGKTYKVEIKQKGFQSYQFPLETTPNVAYILGNVVFGGLIGWFIVDPGTGAMYDLAPPEKFQTIKNGSDGIIIKLIPDLEQNLSFNDNR